MAYVDDKEAQAKSLVGRRIEIPVHYDMWMRGARFGKVIGLSWERNGAGERIVRAVRVRMDHPQVRRCVKIWRIDLDYIRTL